MSLGGHYGLCHCDTVNVIQWLFCANAILVFVLLQFGLDVPYGRYRDSKWTRSCAWIWEGTINANVSWFLQELPSFVVPLSSWLYATIRNVQALPTQFCLVCFVCTTFTGASKVSNILLFLGSVPTKAQDFEDRAISNGGVPHHGMQMLILYRTRSGVTNK